MSLYNFYFEQQEKYANIYGKKTIVFMQIGHFHESYCDKQRGYQDLDKLEPLLNVKYIRRDGNKKHKDKNKPNQLGFPSVSLSRHVATLTENGYTVVIFDQVNHSDDEVGRQLTGIYSAGTYIPEVKDTNYILSVYMCEEKQISSVRALYAIGITLVDVVTGKSMVHEFYSKKDDEKFGLDELLRTIQTFRPSETIIYYHTLDPQEETINELKVYLELDRMAHSFYIYYQKKGNDKLNLLQEDYFKISYQNDYLSQVFNLNYQLSLNRKQSAIEILDLEKKPYVTISLIIMLKYLTEHNTNLVKNLSYPTAYVYSQHLILGNNAIEQLNIVDCNSLEYYDKKFKSIFDVVNKTSTPMGRRFLRENLLNPLSQKNKNEILRRYQVIENLLQGKLFEKIKCELKNIHDIERLHRKMATGVISPYEFYRLDLYYQATVRITSMIKDNEVIELLISGQTMRDFLEYQIKYNKEFNFEEMQNYTNYGDIENSFFNKGIHERIDFVQAKVEYARSIIESTLLYFQGLLAKRCKGKELIVVECNDGDGYFFSLTKTRERILKEELSQINGKIKIDLSIGQTLVIEKKDIIFKSRSKGSTKITITPLVEHTVNLSKHKNRLISLIKRQFIKSMLQYYLENKALLFQINKFVSELDFLVSGATVANQYYYSKPTIPSMENIASYFSAKRIRHALTERLCQEVEYVPNDVELGNVPEQVEEKNGILLYGVNASGKSNLMKAIGVAIILAQIGYYVPAEEFVYEPYMALYARITGNDNIFKGQSSFALEMIEIDAILNRTRENGINVLVIGDEVCRGTESVSGISIVAATLLSLSAAKCTYIFSSHLHDLPEMEEVRTIRSLRIYHLKVEYDERNDCLVYDRQLQPGAGPKVYGLMVAKYFVKDINFITTAEKIKKRLIQEDTHQIPKKSHFNNNLLVKSCLICGYRPVKEFHKELECHHINFQKNCWEDGKIKEKPYLHKNRLYNLVILCRRCHEKTHRGEILIKGYLDTTIGPILDYQIDHEKTITNALKEFENIRRRIS